MTVLKNLKVVAKQERLAGDPFTRAKAKLLKNLNTQMKSVEASLAGETYTVAKMKYVVEDGEKKGQEVQRPVRKWYWCDNEGKMRFAIRIANKVLEIQKGKTDFVVEEEKELPDLIVQLVQALNSGEFDSLIKEHIKRHGKQAGK